MRCIAKGPKIAAAALALPVVFALLPACVGGFTGTERGSMLPATVPGAPTVIGMQPASSCGNRVCDVGELYLNCPQDCPHRVGAFYSGWHQPAYHALAVLQQHNPNASVLTIEQLLRSRREDGSPTGTGYQFAQLLQQPGLVGTAANFYYQHSPRSGPYCIVYQRQPGDINYNATHEGTYGSGPVPDCPNVTQTLTEQAELLVAAGVDYVVVDGTNIFTYDAFGDAIELRPFEVLVEQWSALRARGIATPEVAMWQRFPVSPVTASDANDWLWRHVLQVYNAPGNANVIMHEAATGRPVYFYFDSGDFDPAYPGVITGNGGGHAIAAVPMWAYGLTPNQWSFLSQCRQGADIDDAPCEQPVTATSILGSQIAVAPSYQIPRASIAGQVSGVYNGLVLRKQFATALAAQPNYVLLASWNESIAQPQNYGPSMGLETDPTANGAAFVDNYGVEYSRDIEPSAEYGSLIYDLVRSCLRVYRTGATTCNDPGEACCQGGNFSDRYVRYSDTNGTFVVYAPSLGPSSARVPLWSCQAASGQFFALDAGCVGEPQLGLLGYISTTKGGETLRSLWRCKGAGAGAYAYTVAATCPAGMQVDAVLGYVR